jgi:hypothetical protein
MKKLVLVLIPTMVLAGCAGYDNLSGAQKGAVVGAGTGAAAGAIIGSQVKGNRSGHAGTGAIIGALGGAAAGALIGDAMQKPAGQGQDRGQLQPVPAPSQASVTVAGQYPSDPTLGQVVNGTPFKVQPFIDTDPGRDGTTAYTMNPNEVLPVNLDVGRHRIVAIATRDTQFGPRTVGRLDRPLNMDVRGSGWEMRFNEGDFR